MVNGVWEQVEILFGSIGVILSLYFSVLLLNRKNKSNIFLAIYLIAFALRIGKSLFHNYYEISPVLRTYMLNFMFCIGPSIWLFSKYLLTPQKTIARRDWGHYGLFLILLSCCWLIPNNNSGALSFDLFYQASIVHIFLYCLYTFLYFYKTKMSTPTARRISFRTWHFRFMMANLILLTWYVLISYQIIDTYMGISFLYSIIIIAFGIGSMRASQLFAEPKVKYEDSTLSKEKAAALFQQIQHLVQNEKLYLESSLTLAKLSKQVGASAKEVSQAINQVEGFNYAQFIASFRVAEAKRLLRSPNHAHYSIAAIAHDSGFNSISSFNALFKKHTQLTARQYRAQVED